MMLKKETAKVYPPETAGRLMTKKVPAVYEQATIADIENLLLQKVGDFETINYIYVLDKGRRLKGIISLKEVFRSKKSAPLKKLLPKRTISVRPRSDQERVAFLALKNNLKAVPVVDKAGRFLGVVPSDQILRILDSEAVEDILRFGGIFHKGALDNILKISIGKSLRHRLPWLLIGLFGGLSAAGIVKGFEGTLSKNLILAAFIPLIVYMADAVGTQMEVFIIRDLALEPKMSFGRYFFRQLSIVILIALISSFLLFSTSLIFYKKILISFVLGVGLFFAIFSSVFTGLIIPFLFGKLRLDPANASGPVATIIQDVLSILIYLAVAFWLL